VTERPCWGWQLPGARDGAALARRECLPPADVLTVAWLLTVVYEPLPAAARALYVSGFWRGYRAVRESLDINEGRRHKDGAVTRKE